MPSRVVECDFLREEYLVDYTRLGQHMFTPAANDLVALTVYRLAHI